MSDYRCQPGCHSGALAARANPESGDRGTRFRGRADTRPGM